jgi:uncharacterized membrane protein YebE (DUF533 family)
MKTAMGGGNLLENLSGLLGKQPAGSGGGLGSILSQALGKGGGAAGGGLGGVLGNVLNDAERVTGGKQNLALGGLGALAGAILGGGGKSIGGAVGGGLMALLGAMAYQALKGEGRKPEVPLGLVEPQSQAEQQQLEHHSEIVLKAMINAAKADGQIDPSEVQRITGKLQDSGADREDQQYVMTEMLKPMDTASLVAAAKAQPTLAAEVYAASLLAIEVDTPAEKEYLEQLASGLGLSDTVTQRIRELVGLPS